MKEELVWPFKNALESRDEWLRKNNPNVNWTQLLGLLRRGPGKSPLSPATWDPSGAEPRATPSSPWVQHELHSSERSVTVTLI